MGSQISGHDREPIFGRTIVRKRKYSGCVRRRQFLCREALRSFECECFAKIDKDRRAKWKKSSASFTKNVIAEELRVRIHESMVLREEINGIYDEIRQTCSLFRYMCIL